MPTGPRAMKPQASVWLNDRAAGARRKKGTPGTPGAAGANAADTRTAPESIPAGHLTAVGSVTAASLATSAGNGHRRVPQPEQPPGLDLERIVRTTIAMLDTGGLAGFSMRRLAAELGVTPMSVYWYVDNKDDLLEIALDEIGGEVPVPWDAPDADWRSQLRDVATGYRAMLVAHPWASRLMGEYMNLGPKATAFSTAMYKIMRRTGLPDAMISGALSTVYQFTFGFGTVEGRWGERCRTSGISEDELYQEVSGAVRDHPGFHGLADLMDRRARAPLAELRERDFAFALDLHHRRHRGHAGPGARLTLSGPLFAVTVAACGPRGSRRSPPGSSVPG